MNEHNNSPTSTKSQDEISWRFNVPMLNDRFFMADFFKVATLSPLIMMLVIGIGFAVVGDIPLGEALRMLAVMGLIGFAGLAVLMAFVCLAFFRNRFPMDFTVSRDSILGETGESTRKLNRFVMVTGLLFGNGRVVGAALLAQAQQSVAMRWAGIRVIEYYPHQRVISVKNSWRTVLRLYCTAENYEQVAKYCRGQFEATACDREEDIRQSIAFKKELASDIKTALIWIGAALLSSVLLRACPLLENPSLVWAAFGACAVGSLTGGEVRRFFGIASIVLAAGIAIGVIANGMAVKSGLFGLVRVSGFEGATGGSDLAPFVVSMVGLVGLVVCALRNALPRAKLIPVAALALAGICVGGLMLGGLSHYNVDTLRARGPELQAVDTEPWDSALISDFKQKYNERLRLHKLYMNAKPAEKSRMTMQRQTALTEYQSALAHVRQSGSNIEIREANLLDDAFALWLRMKPHH